eukprot:TRINITY_DN19838_c0_g1_i2.p1 TRINITY_DN19838_c0_g1~~TRINITY_DN19838_c0_g1_i2.p1  ORF type:complete len:207 (+),score=33.81 TRINITY_DN19838_c0_g1_i2:145-765(+)
MCIRDRYQRRVRDTWTSKMRGLLSALNQSARQRPLAAAILIAGSKNFVFDLLVQLGSNWDGEVDWRRSGIFTMFGVGYVGGAQYYVFNKLFPRLLGPGLANKQARSVAAAVLLDNLVHIPLVYLPCFYCMRQLAYTPDQPAMAVQSGLESWQKNLTVDMSMQACVFVPIQTLNFSLNPAHLRVPTAVAGGAIWISILSFCRGSEGS